MKKVLKTLLKVFKWIGIVILGLIIVLLLIRFVGKLCYNRTPDGGINETMYADINGTKQWISIYGQDRDNPVLLYIHGGPFAPTSWADWGVWRKLSADYTVVNWDQRGYGHNYPKYQVTEPISAEDMIADGKALTDFLCDYLDKEKITVFGHSMGSIYAANLALDYPEKYDAVIVGALIVDEQESRIRFKEYQLAQTVNDPEMHALVEQIDPAKEITEQEAIYQELMLKGYAPTEDIFAEAETNLFSAIWLNPYCTLGEQYNMLFADKTEYDMMVTNGSIHGEAYSEQLSIADRTQYQVPFYLIQGENDHNVGTMVEVAAAYYEKVEAPDKDICMINGGHVSPLLCCDQLAAFVHKIAEKNHS